MKYCLSIFAVIITFTLKGQTPTTDLFDGWGKSTFSIYEENDFLSAGSLNQRDANFTQGVRIEALYEDDGTRPNSLFNYFNTTLKNNFEMVTVRFKLGPSTDTSTQPTYHRTGERVDNPRNIDKKTGVKVANEQFLMIKDQRLNREILLYYKNNGHEINYKKDSINDRIDFYSTFTGAIPSRLNSEPNDSADNYVSIKRVRYDVNTNKTYFIVWLRPYFYQNIKLIAELEGNVSTPALVNNEGGVQFSGYVCQDNIYPFKPTDIISENDINKMLEYDTDRRQNREGITMLRGFNVGQFMYTSPLLTNTTNNTDILEFRKTVGPAYRPAVGMLFVGAITHSHKMATNEYLFSETRYGVWGPMAFAKETQGSLHSVINYVDNPSWKYQIRPHIPFFIQASNYYRHDFVNSAMGFKVGYIVGADIGNIQINGSAGFLLKGGAFETMRYVKAGYPLGNKINTFFSKWCKFYYYVKPVVTAVAINGLLSGTLGSNDANQLIGMEDLNHLFIQVEGGIGLRLGRCFSVSYSAVSRSAEYAGQPNNINWGRLLVRVDW